MSGSETIDEYLGRLGSNQPTPGAGAVGAIHAAQAAALIGMVTRFTERSPAKNNSDGASASAARDDGGASAGSGHNDGGASSGTDRSGRPAGSARDDGGASAGSGADPDLEAILAEAGELTRAAVHAAVSDEEKFRRVVDCYKLPNTTDDERSRRSSAIREALVEATLPARAQLDLASAVVRLGTELVGVCNPNVLSDIAVAAEAARAAAATARITVEANLTSIREESIQESLQDHTRKADDVVRRAEELSASVRRRVLD